MIFDVNHDYLNLYDLAESNHNGSDVFLGELD